MTVLEIATINVIPGQEEAFADAYRGARHLLTELDGCLSVRMTRGEESPSLFMLLVEWESIEAHVSQFRSTPRWERWREQIGPHFAEPPVVEHFHEVPVV